MESIRLTQFSHGSGCGCKIAPSVLEEILGQHKQAPDNKHIIVGNNSADDAAVFDLQNGNYLISTTDFFTPIVDDAFQFGRIAATNAISDVYAMGGKPSFALAILGWPVNQLPADLASNVLEGARSVCNEAGIVIAGGHSIDIPEPVFGLAVNGFVAANHLKRNNTPQEGDVLFLTKPLGVGIISTAQKRGLANAEEMDIAISTMTQLNTVGIKFGSEECVHAMTDVTGFGLLGHLSEMIAGTDFSAEIHYSAIPLLAPAKKYAAQFVYPDNTMRNWNAYQSITEGISGESLLLLCDPQTSGGLLVAVSESEAEKFSSTYQLSAIGKIIRNTSEKRLIILP